MDKHEQELRAEQKRVRHVAEKAGQRLRLLKKQMDQVKSNVVEIRKGFWDDVRVNFDDPEEALETATAIKQQAEVLGQRERSHQHMQKELDKLKRLCYSPYFGRIDFREDGENETDRVYIGIGSFQDENNRFLVYDWRAPISSLYYDFSPGPAQYETPGGILKGTMELKRQFLIRDGEIKAMFDTGVIIGDELLQEVLGKQADHQMKSIVATIQKEQNRIIRNERSRLLIVQGAAGSGKTSAALQRVAYLLYRYRDHLRPEQIVLFSPNPLFNSYVSTVLPELGEENMAQTTFPELLEKRLGHSFRLETPFELMEYILTKEGEPGYAARMAGIRFKSSLQFMELIDRYVSHLGQTDLLFRDVKLRGEIIIPKTKINEHFTSLDPKLPIPNRLQLVAEQLLAALAEKAKEERHKPWVKEEINYMSQEEYQKAYNRLQQAKRYSEDTFDDFQREEELLSTRVVDQHFKPLRKSIKQLQFVRFLDIYRQLFTDPEYVRCFWPDFQPPRHWTEICRQTSSRLQKRTLAYEDQTPFLYLREQLSGFHVNRSVKHLFIDEAQDYSPFQFAYLKKLFPLSKMTILGDLKQAIFSHTDSELETFQSLTFLSDGEEIETIVLNRTYRSTRPIVEFTRAMIPGGEAIVPFNRAGKKPTVTQLADKAALREAVRTQIRELLLAQHQTIAVIGKTAAECQEIYQSLKPHFDIQLIREETAAFKPGIIVIPSYLAKGIELDAVIIWNASEQQYHAESVRKLFYTACTRAMHELHLFTPGKPSPFILDASPETYDLRIKA